MSNVRLRRLQADYDKLRAFLAQQPRIRLIQAQGIPPGSNWNFRSRASARLTSSCRRSRITSWRSRCRCPIRGCPRNAACSRRCSIPTSPRTRFASATTAGAGEPLWSMIAQIGEMMAYQSYNTKSPLNGEAARWVEANQDRLPLDHTKFMLDDSATAI